MGSFNKRMYRAKKGKDKENLGGINCGAEDTGQIQQVKEDASVVHSASTRTNSEDGPASGTTSTTTSASRPPGSSKPPKHSLNSSKEGFEVALQPANAFKGKAVRLGTKNLSFSRHSNASGPSASLSVQKAGNSELSPISHKDGSKASALSTNGHGKLETSSTAPKEAEESIVIGQSPATHSVSANSSSTFLRKDETNVTTPFPTQAEESTSCKLTKRPSRSPWKSKKKAAKSIPSPVASSEAIPLASITSESQRSIKAQLSKDGGKSPNDTSPTDKEASEISEKPSTKENGSCSVTIRSPIGKEPSSNSLPASSSPIEPDYRSVLKSFYIINNPPKSNDANLDKTLRVYKGREVDMFADLAAKYKKPNPLLAARQEMAKKRLKEEKKSKSVFGRMGLGKSEDVRKKRASTKRTEHAMDDSRSNTEESKPEEAQAVQKKKEQNVASLNSSEPMSSDKIVVSKRNVAAGVDSNSEIRSNNPSEPVNTFSTQSKTKSEGLTPSSPKSHPKCITSTKDGLEISTPTFDSTDNAATEEKKGHKSLFFSSKKGSKKLHPSQRLSKEKLSSSSPLMKILKDVKAGGASSSSPPVAAEEKTGQTQPSIVSTAAQSKPINDSVISKSSNETSTMSMPSPIAFTSSLTPEGRDITPKKSPSTVSEADTKTSNDDVTMDTAELTDADTDGSASTSDGESASGQPKSAFESNPNTSSTFPATAAKDENTSSTDCDAESEDGSIGEARDHEEEMFNSNNLLCYQDDDDGESDIDVLKRVFSVGVENMCRVCTEDYTCLPVCEPYESYEERVERKREKEALEGQETQ